MSPLRAERLALLGRGRVALHHLIVERHRVLRFPEFALDHRLLVSRGPLQFAVRFTTSSNKTSAAPRTRPPWLRLADFAAKNCAFSAIGDVGSLLREHLKLRLRAGEILSVILIFRELQAHVRSSADVVVLAQELLARKAMTFSSLGDALLLRSKW